MNSYEIKRYLENKFHIKFIIKTESIDSFRICLSDSNNDCFYLRITVKNNIRLIVMVEPEKYGKEFVALINYSNAEKRRIFCEYWKRLKNDCLCVRVNDTQVTIDDFLNDNSKWETFSLRYSISPYYDEGEDKKTCICEIISNIIAMVLSLIEYEIEGFTEGNETYIKQKKYERNPINRQLCLLNKGYKCSVCGFDFKKTYGEIGEHFIEVHHTIPVSTMGENYVVDPVNELFPLCSNCHSMIHRKDPPYTIEELKQIMEEHKNEDNRNKKIPI